MLASAFRSSFRAPGCRAYLAGNSYAKAAAAPSKDFQPKLKVTGDGSELATLMFTLATKNNERDTVMDQLNQIKSKFKEDVDFWTLFRTNNVKDEHLKHIGFAPSLLEAMNVGKQKKQLQHLAKVMKHYQDMLEAEPRDLTAIVTVPYEWSSKELVKFDSEIRALYPDVCGHNNITVTQKVDPNILDGYTLSLGNLYVDNSGKRHLAAVEQYVERTIDAFYDPKVDQVLKSKGWA